jgi:quercetin dioxygenase-like cupin family protein
VFSQLRENLYHRIGMSDQTVVRKQLLSAVLGNRNVTSVDVREISMAPGQQGGRHLHPCAVVGYITSGTAVYQIEGEDAQTLLKGSAFYEPADAVIANFGNASDLEPMTFVAFYLLDGEQELIRMLPDGQSA